jgi:NAD(P)H-hydrate epimerase
MGRLDTVVNVPCLPDRPVDAHKGTFGTVIVVGGSEGMVGAPALCATAALRVGTGLVRVATWPGLLNTVLSIQPCATGIVLDASPAITVGRINDVDPNDQAVLAVGPGLGRSDVGMRLVDQLLREPRPVVLDADGLNALVASGRLMRRSASPLVMTPHPGEFRRLAQPLGISEDPTDPGQRPWAAARLAEANGAIVVLKGAGTIVTDGERCYTNATGNPALASAGSGDVLTGLISGLMAQGLEPFDAAVLGVYLHGLAGDLWAEQHGPRGLIASDLVDLLPEAMHGHAD